MIKNIYSSFMNRIFEFLHFLYILIGNSDIMNSKRSWSREQKNYLRTGLFCFSFIYMIIVYNHNLYLNKNYFKYHNLIIAFILLVISYISKEKELKAGKWSGNIAKSFFLFYLLVCISDFIVLKQFQSVGIMMLLVAGLFFLIWQTMEYPDDIFQNMIHALEIIAVGGGVYNVCFRLKYDGLLYNGYMSSASDFGVFSSFLVLIFLIEIYECQKTHNINIKMGFFICGLAISVLQTLMSGKEIAIIYTGLLIIIALGWWVFIEFKTLNSKEKMRMFGYLILTVGITGLYYFAVKNIPWKFQSMIQYKKEIFESRKDPAFISILAESGIGVYQKVEFHTWGQQISVWNEYIKKINLFGHKLSGIKIVGRQHSAQNQILQIIYRYGIITVIPYITMFYLALKKSMKVLWDTKNNWKNTDLLAGGLFLFWWLVGSFGNIEYPYYQPIWLMAYFMLGRYMIENKQTS